MSLYYATVFVFLIVAAPFLLASAKRRAGLFQKLGMVPRTIIAEIHNFRDQITHDKPAIWFHAVSVGEFNGALPLIQEFHKRNPDYQLFVSTTTATGQSLAKQRLGDKAIIFFLPLDLPFAISAWLDLIKPIMVVIVETEIWPGFTYECERRGIRLAIVNARMSPRSFKNYMSLRKFFAIVINRFELIAVQSADEADRFRQLAYGIHEDKTGYHRQTADNAPLIVVTGNLKYDQLQPVKPAQIAQLRKLIKIGAHDRVIIGGSTHDGEESALLEAYQKLLGSSNLKNDSTAGDSGDSNYRLILAPRHPERWDKVCRLVKTYGFHTKRYSASDVFESKHDVYVLDTIGQLYDFYALATVAFVGGSLVPVGGHNLVEPYVGCVPVVCGPQLFKTINVAQQLKDIGALTIIKDKEQLYDALYKLLEDEDLRHNQGVAGNAWLQRSQGAVVTTVDLLEKMLAVTANSSLSFKIMESEVS